MRATEQLAFRCYVGLLTVDRQTGLQTCQIGKDESRSGVAFCF